MKGNIRNDSSTLDWYSLAGRIQVAISVDCIFSSLSSLLPFSRVCVVQISLLSRKTSAPDLIEYLSVESGSFMVLVQM